MLLRYGVTIMSLLRKIPNFPTLYLYFFFNELPFILPHADSLIVTGSPSQIIQIDNLYGIGEH